MKVGDQKSISPPGGQSVERREQTNRAVKGQAEERRDFSDLLKRKRDPGNEQKREIREGKAQVRDRQSDAQVQDRRVGGDERGQTSGDEGRYNQEVQIGLGEAGDSAVGGREGSSTVESFDMSGGPLEGDAPVEVGGVSELKQASMASSAGSAAATAMEQITGEILRAVQVGEDGQARKVVFLDVQIPGHGDLRIRLRREGGGLEVRMRADNDGLARLVREHSEALRGRAKEKGVEMTSIQVVR